MVPISLHFFCFFPSNVSLLDPDPDPWEKINADPDPQPCHLPEDVPVVFIHAGLFFYSDSLASSIVIAHICTVGAEEDGGLHLADAAEDCQAPGGDTGPQKPELSARGQLLFFCEPRKNFLQFPLCNSFSYLQYLYYISSSSFVPFLTFRSLLSLPILLHNSAASSFNLYPHFFIFVLPTSPSAVRILLPLPLWHSLSSPFSFSS